MADEKENQEIQSTPTDNEQTVAGNEVTPGAQAAEPPPDLERGNKFSNAGGCSCLLGLLFFLVAFFFIHAANVKNLLYILGGVSVVASVIAISMGGKDVDAANAEFTRQEEEKRLARVQEQEKREQEKAQKVEEYLQKDLKSLQQAEQLARTEAQPLSKEEEQALTYAKYKKEQEQQYKDKEAQKIREIQQREDEEDRVAAGLASSPGIEESGLAFHGYNINDVPVHLRRLMNYQDGLKVSAHTAEVNSCLQLVFGIVCLALGFILRKAEVEEWPVLMFAQSYLGFLAAAGYIIGFISLISAVPQLISSSLKSAVKVRETKKAICPHCKTEETVYLNVKKFACFKCFSILLLSSDDKYQPRESSCPYCGYKSYVAEDHGQFRCPDCGVRRQSKTGGIEDVRRKCHSCGADIPQSALYCNNCLAITAESLPVLDAGDQTIQVDRGHKDIWDFSNYAYSKTAASDLDDPYWIDGKTPKGRLIYIMAMLNTIRKDAPFFVTEPAKIGLTLAKFADLINSLKQPLRDKELVADPQLSKILSRAITLVDVTYADLIQIQLREAERLFMSGNKVFESETKGLTFTGHMDSRNAMIYVAQKTSLPLDIVDTWNSKLMETTHDMDFVRGVVGMEDWYIKEADLSKMREEARRLREWAASRQD